MNVRARFATTLLLLALPAVGCVESPLSPDAMGRRALSFSMHQGTQAERYEINFMTGMIDHHAMAVMMAEMCEEKAVHASMDSLCDAIITTQSAEIDTLQSWLQDWYGVTHEPDAGRMDAQLERLTGEEFEIRFMQLMIRHHAHAVRLGEQCEDRAEHESLVMMCQEMTAAQTAEIELMEQWLCDWYDRCGGGSPQTTSRR